MEVVRAKARKKALKMKKALPPAESCSEESELSKKMKAAFVKMCGQPPEEYRELFGECCCV